jgi:hypothetical protein
MDLGIKAANDQIQALTTAQRTTLAGTATLGQLVWDSDLKELFVYLNGSAGNAWFGIGNYIICTFATRPATPVVGMLIYQTDTDEMLKYVTDADNTQRWMLADHDYRRNVVINSGFDVWQRNTTFNPTSATSTTKANYGADRWQFLQATTNAAGFTRQPITATDPVGFNYFLRVQRAAAATLVTPFTVQTSFESQNIQQFRNKFVTLSFWARAGANYSAASSFLVSDIVIGTGTDNTVGNFTGNSVYTTTNNVLTTSWKRFSITTSAPLFPTTTQLGVRFVFTPVGTAGAADSFDITGVQVEPTSAPSDHEFRDAGEELARCQRYYHQVGPISGVFDNPLGAGYNAGTTVARFVMHFPVTMRGIPPSILTSGTASHYGVQNLATTTNGTSVPTLYSATQVSALVTLITGATLVAGQASVGVFRNDAAFLGFTAEL